MEYINKNASAVKNFSDLKDKAYLAFYDIMEAANTLNATSSANAEKWVKYLPAWHIVSERPMV